MKAELEEKLGYEKSERVSNTGENGKSKNYRNGYSKKTVKTQLGEVDVKIPRNRNGEYEPQIIEKYNRNADGMEEKILALYACGMSQSDISEQIKNLYDVEISDGLVSKIVDKITPDVTAWQLFIRSFLWMRSITRSRKIINILQKPRMLFWVFRWTELRKKLGRKLGHFIYVFCISRQGSEDNIYDEHYRGIEPSVPQNYKE